MPVSHTSVPVVKHVPSMPPSSPEPPSVLLTAPALPVSKIGTKQVLLAKIPQEHFPRPLKGARCLCHFLSPFQCACCVTRQITTQIFTGRKDRKTVCTHKNCLVSFPAAASSFTLEPSPAAWALQPQPGRVRVQGYTGSCGKSHPKSSMAVNSFS